MGLRKTFSNRIPLSFKDGLRQADSLTHLSFSDLKNFVRAHGVSALIKRAIVCPCVKEDTGQPSINCGVCRGTGFAYLENNPENSNCTGKRIIMGARSQQKNWNRKGGYTKTGQTTAVICDYLPSVGDLVQPKVDIEIINDEFHKRGHLYNNGKTSEFLFHERIKKVEGIYCVNADKTQLVSYIKDIDFRMNERLIEWIQGGNSPNLGERYTVRYQAIPEYIVLTSEPSFHVEHDDDEPLSVRETFDKPIVYDVSLVRVDQILKGRKNEEST